MIIRPGTKAILKLDAEKRLQSMRNHTISHLISLAIQDLYPASYFKSFMANDAISRSTFRVLGKQFDPLGNSLISGFASSENCQTPDYV